MTIGVGNKEQAPLQVFITQPKAGATVSGTVWVVMWVEGTSGASNVFTLSADGKQVGSQTTNDEGLADAGAASPFRLPRLHPGIGVSLCLW